MKQLIVIWTSSMALSKMDFSFLLTDNNALLLYTCFTGIYSTNAELKMPRVMQISPKESTSMKGNLLIKRGEALQPSVKNL